MERRLSRCQCMHCLSFRGNWPSMILSKYKARNSHLAAIDAFRNECGNGFIEASKRRKVIVSIGSFDFSVPITYQKAPSYVSLKDSPPESCSSQEVSEEWTENMRKHISDYIEWETKMQEKSIATQNHFSLICASRASMLDALYTRLMNMYPHRWFYGQRFLIDDTIRPHFQKTKANAHNEINRSSIFTQLTRLQRIMLLSHGGLSGVLISKLIQDPSDCIGTSKLFQSAKLIANRSKNANACEILADNRFGIFKRKITRDYVIPKYDLAQTEEAIEWIKPVYPEIILRMHADVKALKRGFISIETIHSNKEYTEFILKWLGVFAYFVKSSNRWVVFPEITNFMTFLAICPQFIDFDLGRALGLSSLFQVSRRKMLEFSKGGIIAAFLAFIKIEPRMANQFLAPRLSTDRQTNSPEDIQNYVPSKCPVLGPLKQEYQDFIPRLGDMTSDICRRTGCHIVQKKFSLFQN
jgi:hypothetical protein